VSNKCKFFHKKVSNGASYHSSLTKILKVVEKKTFSFEKITFFYSSITNIAINF